MAAHMLLVRFTHAADEIAGFANRTQMADVDLRTLLRIDTFDAANFDRAAALSALLRF